MGDTYLEPATAIRDIVRSFLSFFDRPAYWLLGIVYELFFNVASADLFSNATIMKFYGRVQIILGVFMMFQLAMIILKGIVNPDTFTDAKSGAGHFIGRVATSLILITLLMPISIPGARNEYEKQINNNGLIFGTLYSLQHRILSNNTIGRLVLGTTDTSSTFNVTYPGVDSNLKKSARIFTSTIIKGFYRINLVPESERNTAYIAEGKDPAIYNENRVCKDIDDAVLRAYTRIDAEPSEIIDLVNATCDSNASPGFLNSLWTGVQKLTGSTKYVFVYNPVISFIVPVIFIFILLSFTVDVAVRAIKLSVLRLIAPIPLISYMDPKGSKDSAFNAWTKALVSTYLDLFIRLAAVYFVIFLIQDMIVHGISIDLDARSGAIGVLSLIIIWIGLFIFAKQAPKFIKQVIGLKEDAGGKLFSGFGELAAVAAVGTGVVGGAISRGVGTATNTNGNFGKKLVTGIGGGIAGAISGGVSAGQTYWNSKEANAKNIMNQVRANNARNYSNAADESTLHGRLLAGLQANLGFRNDKQIMDDKIKYYGAADSALGRITKAFDNHGDYKVEIDRAFMAKLANTGTARGRTYYIDGDTLYEDAGKTKAVLKAGQKYSLKDFNDIVSLYSSSSDGTLKDAVNEAKKQAQGMRFNELRAFGNTPEGREALIARIDDPTQGEWTQNDLVAYDALRIIYDVSQKYGNEAVFSALRGTTFDDPNVSWGKYKGAASGAGRAADQIKNSYEYSTASANDKRASEQAKK